MGRAAHPAGWPSAGQPPAMGNGRLPAAFARATLRGSDSIESDADGGEEDRAASVVEATSLHASNRARRLALGKKELCWIPCAAIRVVFGRSGSAPKSGHATPSICGRSRRMLNVTGCSWTLTHRDHRTGSHRWPQSAKSKLYSVSLSS